MKRLELVLLLLFCLSPMPNARGDEFTDLMKGLAANAALQYWRAFAAMPQFSEEEKAIRDQWSSRPIDARAAQLLARCQGPLNILVRGSRLKECQWGLPVDGPSLLLPHLVPARQISQVACLRARQRLEKGDWKGAGDDLLAVLTLGRHLAADSYIIMALVERDIEEMAIQTLAVHLPGLGAPALKDLAARLDSLPPPVPLERMVAVEKEALVGRPLQILEASELAGNVDLGIDRLVEEWAGDPALFGDFFKDLKSQPQKGKQHLRETGDFFNEFARLVNLPPDQFLSQNGSLLEKVRKSNRFASAVFPNTASIYSRVVRTRIRLAMLQAAVAVRLNGPDRAASAVDPVTGKSFDYAPRPQGFTLESRARLDGEPVRLVVGK